VQLSTLVQEDIDRFVVLAGWSDEHSLNQQLGFSWPAAREQARKCCDPPNIWAFVKGHVVIAYFRPSGILGNGDRVKIGSYSPTAVLRYTPAARGRAPSARISK
jgi:hypothetical protein